MGIGYVNSWVCERIFVWASALCGFCTHFVLAGGEREISWIFVGYDVGYLLDIWELVGIMFVINGDLLCIYAAIVSIFGYTQCI